VIVHVKDTVDPDNKAECLYVIVHNSWLRKHVKIYILYCFFKLDNTLKFSISAGKNYELLTIRSLKLIWLHYSDYDSCAVYASLLPSYLEFGFWLWYLAIFGKSGVRQKSCPVYLYLSVAATVTGLADWTTATLHLQAFLSRPSDRCSAYRTPLLVSSQTPSLWTTLHQLWWV